MQKHESHFRRFRKHIGFSKHHSDRAVHRKSKADGSLALGFAHRFFEGIHKEREERHLDLALKSALKHAEEIDSKYNSFIERLDKKEKKREEQREKIESAMKATSAAKRKIKINKKKSKRPGGKRKNIGTKAAKKKSANLKSKKQKRKKSKGKK